MLPLLAAAALSASPCTYAHLKAKCGSITVPENRRAGTGRKIQVHFVVVPAASRVRKDPVFLIAGGPGQAAIDLWSQYLLQDPVSMYAHASRDIVVVDQRGTGTSHALNCNIYPTDASTYTALFPAAVLRACRDRLAATSDLNAYGSDVAADDLNDIRTRLGYKKIVLSGGSYGTMESFIYMRRHGDSVAAVIMEGVAPPALLLPKPFPQGAQRALEDLERSCAADTMCAKHFPGFAGDFAKMLAQSKNGGIAVPGGRIVFEVFADRMRQTMYDAYGASFLPLIIHDAAAGNTKPLAHLIALVSHGIPGSLAMGMNLSLTCAGSMPFITGAQAAAAAQGTFMGDSRYRAQRTACNLWNVRPDPISFLAPVRSNAPVLMIGGSADPATPPQFGARALRYLPNGRQILIPHAGHDFGSKCTYAIEEQFLRTYSTRNLNVSCLKAEGRPPFALTLKGLP